MLARPVALVFTVVLLACKAGSQGGRPDAPVALAASSAPAASSSAPADAAAPAASGYDLAGDVARRIAAARKLPLVGATAPISVESDVIILVGVGQGVLVGPAATFIHQVMAAFYNGRFTRRIDRAVTLFVFSTRALYDQFVGPRYPHAAGDLGYYDPDRREVVVDLSQGLASRPTISHELVHVAVGSGDMDDFGDFLDAPGWLDECLGTNYEDVEVTDDGGIRGLEWGSIRIGALKEGLRSTSTLDPMRVDALFGMGDLRFRAISPDGGQDQASLARHYALARFFCLWMEERSWLWPFYREWRKTYDHDRTGKRAFEKVVGMTPTEAQQPWEQWARGVVAKYGG